MIVEGVTFNEERVRNMKKRDFINTHKNVFFLDRPPEEREKTLSSIYDDIASSGAANALFPQKDNNPLSLNPFSSFQECFIHLLFHELHQSWLRCIYES